MRYFNILICRVLDEWHGLVKLLNRQLHLFGENLRTYDEACFACHFYDKIENATTPTLIL